MYLFDTFFLKKTTRAFLLIRRNILLSFTSKKSIRYLDADKISYSLVYLCHEKDIDVLETSIKESPGNVVGTLEKIYLVYPDEQKLKFRNRFSHISYVELTDEEILADFLSAETRSILAKIQRQGWIKQQLLKFLVAYIIETQNYLVIDADTVIIDKMIFRLNNKPIFYFSDELEFSYRKYIKRIMGHCGFSTLSFVSHICMFDKVQVKNMMSFISHQKNTTDQTGNIDEAICIILTRINFNGRSILSEYELYYYFINRVAKKPNIVKYWRNKALNLNKWDGSFIKYRNDYYSISFHDYYRK